MMPPPIREGKLDLVPHQIRLPITRSTRNVCVACRHSRRVAWPLTAVCLIAYLALPGCGFVGFPGVYRIDVEQGNLVDQEMIDQLQLGMSRRQVRFIMGSPLVEDTFNPDRWDYPYVIRNGQNIIREAQVSVFFEDDRLTEIHGDYLPEWAREDESMDDGRAAEDESPSATGPAP